MKVLYPTGVSDVGKQYLLDRGYEIVMGSNADPETLKKAIADCDAVLARTNPFPEEIIDAGKKVKIIARHGVDFDNVDVEAATKRGIWVTIAKFTNSNSVAEHTMAMILACMNHLAELHNEIAKGNWKCRDTVSPRELSGKTIGILGLGAIGSRVAESAHFGFHMNVIGYDPFADRMNLPEYVATRKTPAEVIREADVLSLHLPATPETKNMINRDSIATMKDGAVIVNCARGGLVNEDDLADALNSGKLLGAALDVFASEPPDVSEKLFACKNFIASPHNAGISVEAKDAMCLSCAVAIDDVLSGREPKYPVNRPSAK